MGSANNNNIHDTDAARFAGLAPGLPLIESPFFERFAASYFPEPEVLEIARSLNRDGYAIFDFPEAEFERVSAAIKAALNSRFDWEVWRARGWASGAGMREPDCWAYNADVKRIACNEIVLRLLTRLYGRRMWPFQTLNFPVSTQQHFHSDSVHFSTVPERFMCGVWVALEDVNDDAGPLVYYPGSHTWPIVSNETVNFCVAGKPAPPDQSIYYNYWRALVEERGARPVHFTPRKGQALIWAANLLHGGERQLNPDATRWSQVTHYYADDCVYTTPMLSDMVTGNIFFRRMIDISTGRDIESRYCGRSLAEALPNIAYHRDTHIDATPMGNFKTDLRQFTKRALTHTGLMGIARSVRNRLSR